MIVSSAKLHRVVNTPKTYLWKRLSDFKNVGTLLPPPIIDKVECDSNKIGSLRYLTLGNKQKYPGKIIERLDAKYDEGVFVYSIIDKSCLPVRNYIANIIFNETSGQKTEAKISSNWIDESTSPTEMKQMFESLYELMFSNAESQYLEL